MWSLPLCVVVTNVEHKRLNLTHSSPVLTHTTTNDDDDDDDVAVCCRNDNSTTFILLEDVKVPLTNLIGQEGAGFMYLMHNFNHERFFIAAGAGRQVGKDHHHLPLHICSTLTPPPPPPPRTTTTIR